MAAREEHCKQADTTNTDSWLIMEWNGWMNESRHDSVSLRPYYNWPLGRPKKAMACWSCKVTCHEIQSAGRSRCFNCLLRLLTSSRELIDSRWMPKLPWLHICCCCGGIETRLSICCEMWSDSPKRNRYMSYMLLCSSTWRNPIRCESLFARPQVFWDIDSLEDELSNEAILLWYGIWLEYLIGDYFHLTCAIDLKRLVAFGGALPPKIGI